MGVAPPRRAVLRLSGFGLLLHEKANTTKEQHGAASSFPAAGRLSTLSILSIFGACLIISSMFGGCPCCLYLSISGGLACVEALGSFLVSTFCPFRSYDTPLVSTFCRFLTYENGRRGGRLQTSTGRRTFRAFVLWCGCSFQYTAKPPHVGAFLSCVVHIVHVVHIWRRVWYSLNAAGRPLPENG